MNTINYTTNIIGTSPSPVAEVALSWDWALKKADHIGGTAMDIGIPVTVSARHGAT